MKMHQYIDTATSIGFQRSEDADFDWVWFEMVRGKLTLDKAGEVQLSRAQVKQLADWLLKKLEEQI